ncbi:MAG: hypothetical protein ACYC2G_15015, partial [Gemmatimonadaceae bacterium]
MPIPTLTPPGRMTGDRRLALMAIAAAGMLVAVSGAPAAAQATRVRATAPAAAATPAEELRQLRRQAEASRVRLERYVGSLAGRPASAAVLDSLAAMQRSMEVLERRVAFMTERARFRQMEARLERGSG